MTIRISCTKMKVRIATIDRSMPLPMPVKVRPYAHQQAGYDFACRIFGLYDGRIRSHGVAFLMEMGTGKTLTSIGVTGALYQFGLVNRVLVACPLSIPELPARFLTQ